MGVVDEHRVGCGDGDHLHPALHPLASRQGRRDGGDGDAQLPAAGDDPQGVVHAKGPRDGQAHWKQPLRGQDLELHPVRKEPDGAGQQLPLTAVLPKAVALAGGSPGEVAAGGVVDVEKARLALPEQQALGLPIGLHGAVEVQVVPGEVGENTSLEVEPRRAAQGQGVGGDLHHHMGAACIPHLRKEPLDLERLRRGALRGDDLPADHVLIGSDQSHFGPSRLF